MPHFLKKLLLFYLFCLAACSASGIGTGEDGGGGENSQSAVPEVTFDFSDAMALFLQEAISSQTLLASNLQKLASDGTIQPVIGFLGSDQSQPVYVSRIDLSPSGEVYVLFESAILLNDLECLWVMVRQDSSFVCVDTSVIVEALNLSKALNNSSSDISDNFTEIGDGLVEIEFDSQGNLYYGITDANASGSDETPTEIVIEVKKWAPDAEISSLVINASDINLTINRFLPAPDGSLIIYGTLQGTSATLFRYYPGSGSLEVLENVESEGSDSIQMYFDQLYINGGSIIGTFADDGSLTFTSTSNCQGSSVILSGDSVYSIASSYVALINGLSCEEIPLPSISIELFKVVGDYIYVTGTDDAGNYQFIRRQLDDPTQDIDLLQGQNILVQNFDVAENGDVYFGALDLDTTTVYLYKYDNATGQLEQLDSLSGDLEDIILL